MEGWATKMPLELDDVLNVVLLHFEPELLQVLNHADRKIILVLMECSSSATAISKKIKQNRKTVRRRLKKLKSLDVVKEKPSRNSMFTLSEDFIERVSKATRIVLER